MPTSMLSSLARGYGTWTGSFDTSLPQQSECLPSLARQPGEHRHGVTVTPRSKTFHSEVPIADDGHLDIPKTFVTRKGALMLFTAPADIPQEPAETPTPNTRRRRRKPKNVIDLSLKLRTLERLSLSVLQFGDQSYDKESASVSDKENPLVLNFLHHLEDAERDDTDLHSQPGGDLKFYLRDLKRRASCRTHGAGDGGIHRARSTELQEILDQLERAWPHRAESTFGGSAPAGDEFFYPASPTPSMGTARSLSRSKVLSSQKLTASLKSLNYLGRPASTEPERTRITRENLSTPRDYRYGRSKSARPTVWVTDSSTPIYLQPRMTQESTIFHPSVAQSQRDPTPTARDALDTSHLDDGQSQVWVNMDVQENASIVSDDFQSQRSMTDFELRVPLDKGDNQSIVTKSDRPFTPVRSELSTTPVKEERSVMLSEGASILDSLMEEDFLAAEPVEASDDELALEREQWPGREQVESRASSRYTGRVDIAAVDEEGEDDDVPQPLQPPYTAAILAGLDTEGEVKTHLDSEKDQGEDLLTISSTDEAVSSHRRDGVQSAEPEQVSKVKSPTPQTTSLAPDPDTLVSLHKDDHEETATTTTLERTSPQPAPSKADLILQLTTSSSPIPTANSPLPSTGRDEPAPNNAHVATASSNDQQTLLDLSDDLDGPETLQKSSVTPKRRQPAQEPRKSLIPDLDGEEAQEDTQEVGPDGEPKLSERVIKEKEERKLRAAQKKEEQEREAAARQAEADRLKQEADDKKQAAEDRLKQRAEEAARRKEEQLKKQEEDQVLQQSAGPAQGTKSSKKEKKKSDAKKGASVADAAKKTESTLDKLKAKSAASGEVDVEKLKQFMATQPPLPPPKVEKQKVDLPDHMKEMFERKTKSKTEEELEEEISKMKQAADQALGGSVLEADGAEGLSADDFAAAQEALMEKIKKAQEDILEGGSASPKPHATPRPKTVAPKKAKADVGGAKKKSPSPKRKKDPEAEKRQEQARKRAEVKEQEKLEKQRRLEEAKALQQKIKTKEDARRAKEAETKRKAEELQERMEEIRQEEEEIEQAEKDARAQLAAVRKAQREEREARRKADLEKKKQDAIEKREKEKVMLEAARQKEQEMLDRIADAEMARRLREEEEAKRDEEEMAAQERFEAEMKEAQRLAEEEEERLRDLERQAEEEAFQRLLDEKEQAEERRWELEEQARVMREEAEKAQREMLEEESRLEEERKKKEAEEEARKEEERARLIELQRLEEEAREKMRAQLEQRRAWALRRRDQNLAARAHLDAMRQSQGITDPWTFSYFVRWPKESYNRPMGQDPNKKQRGFSPRKPKPPPGPPPDAAAAPAVDVASVPK